MKTIRNLLTGAAFMLALAAAAQVTPTWNQPQQPYSVASASATNNGAAYSWAIIGANSANGGIPVVTAIDAWADTAAGCVAAYRCVAAVTVLATNATVNLSVANTNRIPTGSTVIIRHVSNDTYERATTTTSGAASTNIVLTAAPNTTYPGDIVYCVLTNAAPRWGLTTNSISGGATGNNAAIGATARLFGNYLGAGTRGAPLMLEVNGASASGINNVTVRFEP